LRLAKPRWAAALLVVGLILLGSAIKHYAHEMRLMVPGATLVAL